MATALALIDCNNFYASCEQLFDPALRGRQWWCSPITMAASWRNREARQLGIAMGTPYFQVADRRAISRWWCTSSNYALWR